MNLDRYWRENIRKEKKLRKNKRVKKSSTKNKYTSKYQRNTKTTIISIPSFAKKVETSTDASKAYTNKEGKKNKCSYGKFTTIVNRICA